LQFEYGIQIMATTNRKKGKPMTPQWILSACAAAIIGNGLLTGVFLGFSDFIMRSFRKSSPGAGIESMQVINREVYRSIFITALLGMAVYCIGLLVLAFVKLEGDAAIWMIAGSAIYLVGVVLVTAFGNVPMNQKLDSLPLGSDEAEGYWTHYAKVWTRWNHVRTISNACATVCFLVSFYYLARVTGTE